MKNFNNKMAQYVELKAQIDALQKQLNELKAEFVEDLKSREIGYTNTGLLFIHSGTDYTAQLTITDTLTVDTTAVKKAFPGQFLKPGTRETLTIKHN